MHRILVVDDEPSIRQALAVGLASHEVAVDVAGDGESGVALASTGKYDILIIDLYLPDQDGIEVIKRIKAWNPTIIPIVITAHSPREISYGAIETGVGQCLEKPFTLQSIRAAVAQALAESREIIHP